MPPTPLLPARKATPAAGARPDKGKMTDGELQSLVDGLIGSAAQFTDLELSPQRATATDYYNGRPFGNEEEGRSQVVSTDVADGIVSVMPPMLRVIFGPERVVEFTPRRPDAVKAAEQATDYVNYVFAEQNAGFLKTMSVLKDGLLKKIGIFKWGWDETYTECAYSGEGMTQEQLELLASDDDIELTRVTEDGATPEGEKTFAVEYTRNEKKGRPRIWAVPPEEFIFNREARGFELGEFLFMGHRTRKTRGELIALGVDEKVVKEHGTPDDALELNEEAIARNPDGEGRLGTEDAGESNDKIRYVEGYAYIDFNGDGKSELRRVKTIGAGNHVVENDPVDCAPFAIFCPDPEPHTILGRSWYDRLKDMQLVKSSLIRSSLDSLAQAIFPRTWYKSGDANLPDILNTAIGAPIRTQSGQTAVGTFQHDFVGSEAFPVLQYCDEIIERRTGRAKGAAQIDADALQSTTKTGVDAAITASQAAEEMLVRIFAEGTLKPLFKGLLKLLVQHQPRAEMVRLRGEWVEVDPRSWDADMDVEVKVALGAGLVEQKIQTLAGIVEEMKFIFATFGLQNPFVTFKQYRDTLAEIAELRGRKDSSRYFQPIDMEKLAAEQAAAAQQPPPPSPEMMLAQSTIQLEQQKAQAKLALEQATAEANQQLEQARAVRQHQIEMDKASREQAKLEHDLMLRREQMLLEDDRERDKTAADIALRRLEIELKYGVQHSQAQLDAEIEQTRIHTQAAVDAHDTLTVAETERYATDNQPQPEPAA